MLGFLNYVRFANDCVLISIDKLQEQEPNWITRLESSLQLSYVNQIFPPPHVIEADDEIIKTDEYDEMEYFFLLKNI